MSQGTDLDIRHLDIDKMVLHMRDKCLEMNHKKCMDNHTENNRIHFHLFLTYKIHLDKQLHTKNFREYYIKLDK